MSDEDLGAIPAKRSKQSYIQNHYSGFRRVSIDTPVSVPDIAVTVADEMSQMPEQALKRIADELAKPRLAFERTFDEQRYTRRLK